MVRLFTKRTILSMLVLFGAFQLNRTLTCLANHYIRSCGHGSFLPIFLPYNEGKLLDLGTPSNTFEMVGKIPQSNAFLCQSCLFNSGIFEAPHRCTLDDIDPYKRQFHSYLLHKYAFLRVNSCTEA